MPSMTEAAAMTSPMILADGIRKRFGANEVLKGVSLTLAKGEVVAVIGVRLPDYPAAVVAFTLNYAAYFAEILRAGIQSIDRGQYEGAKVLGFSYSQTMRRIVLPQVVKRILPPMSNETITLVKDTSLIYVLALNDLLRAARGIVQRDFTITPFIVAAGFYLLMTLVLTWFFQRLEKRHAVYD